MRRLPAALRRSIADFSFAYGGLYPDFVYPSPTGGYASFGEELERVRTMDPLAAFEFTRPLYDHEGVRDPKKPESEGAAGAPARRAPTPFEIGRGRTALARVEADRRAPTDDPGTRSARRHQRSRSFEAPARARPRESHTDGAGRLLRSLQPCARAGRSASGALLAFLGRNA